MASDPLPAENQRRALCELIADAFVEIRSLAREGQAEQIEQLADAFHNIPREIFGWGSWSRDLTRGMLADYKARYPSGRDYACAFDRALGAPS